MPKLMGQTDVQTGEYLQSFSYSPVSIDRLGATEYTAVTMIVDQTLSISSFKKDLEGMMKAVAESCKLSPRTLNLLLRVTAFNHKVGIDEIHGWKLLNDINIDDYDGSLLPRSSTNLIDASLNGLDALHHQLKDLYEKEAIVNSNGIAFIITDGDDNCSKNSNPIAIKEAINRILQEEAIESLRTVLITVNDKDPHFKKVLEKFYAESGIDDLISMGDVTPSKLAKLAQFISQSISAQSNQIGTGLPSQPINFAKF